ncbi:Shedu immune nuclease family protein [Collimonas arenae]|uniref:Shedu immune nuclease family protein n=1 Tax=Collimonas arenae TaxID=279058 RepID=UPI00056F2D5D|nr:Shedu immune nuclease family protein [Collimonas arenae]
MQELDNSLILEFENLLSLPAPKGRQKEQVIQDFLETHTELIPFTNRLNHHLHFRMILSKFPLGTELTTDYVYITKSSDRWRITLVELETPDKSIFTNNMHAATPSAEFSAALNQVRNWQIFIDDHKQEVVRKLDPLLRPLVMRNNPIEFNYQLIIGRSDNKNISEARKKLINKLNSESNIEILTYDSLINWYKNDQKFKKNILSLAGFGFKFKYMHFEPAQIFAHVGPDFLFLTAEEKSELRSAGYEIDKWSEGELLIANIKYARSTLEKEMSDEATLKMLNKK